MIKSYWLIQILIKYVNNKYGRFSQIFKLFKGENYSREEAIQRRKILIIRRFWPQKLFKGENCSRVETIWGNTVLQWVMWFGDFPLKCSWRRVLSNSFISIFFCLQKNFLLKTKFWFTSPFIVTNWMYRISSYNTRGYYYFT